MRKTTDGNVSLEERKSNCNFCRSFLHFGLADVSFGIYEDAKNGEFFDSAYSQNLLTQKLIDTGYDHLITDLIGSSEADPFQPLCYSDNRKEQIK